MEGRPGADAAGGQARAVHHQHGLRQRRHRRRGFGRQTHQGQLHDHPRGRRPRHLGPRHADEETRPPAFLNERSHLQSQGAGQPHRRRVHDQGRRHHPELFERRRHRSRFSPHPRHRRPDDRREAAFRRRAGDSLPAPPFPWRRRRARHAALRTRFAAKGRRVAPARGRLGRRRGERVTRFRGRADVRRARSAGAAKGPVARGEKTDRARRAQGTGGETKRRAGTASDYCPSRWANGN